MKTSILASFILAIAISAIAPALGQVPQKINYQGVARDATGKIMANRTIGLRFSIHETTAVGPEIFAETTTAITNDFGTFNNEIGGGTAVYGSFATISWNTGDKYLQIKMDPNGGANYTDMGSYQMLSVAYAQYAKDVLHNDDNDANPSNELQTLSIAGNQLTISSGNTVTLPGGGGGSPGGSNGQVQFNNSGTFGGDANLTWDNNNKRLGIGTSNPQRKLDVNGSINIPVDSSYRIEGYPIVSTKGNSNTFIGKYTGNMNTGSHNTATGYSAFSSNTTANRNTAIGAYSLYTQSYNNGGAGWNTDNVALGSEALYSNQPTSATNGYHNTALGNYTLRSNTTGFDNTASGTNALYFNTTGENNAANGRSALYYNTSGNSNTAIGTYALYSNTIGYQNTALGQGALFANTTANHNTAIGMEALRM